MSRGLRNPIYENSLGRITLRPYEIRFKIARCCRSPVVKS